MNLSPPRNESPLLLASASPRRRDLLRRLGIPTEIQPVSIEEKILPGETGRQAAQRLATEKALLAKQRFPGRCILAADTVVVLDEEILGKPDGPQEATRMLEMLSGNQHRVVTGLALIDAQAGLHEAVSTTQVWFARLDPLEIATYVKTAEPYDKAGAYAIQGAAGWFIEKIEGSASNVVGLPYEQLRRLFASAGLPFPVLSPLDE